MANKLVIMSIYTHNWESVTNLNNRMLNIDKKTIKKNKRQKKQKKQIKNHFFYKKKFFIEIKNQKIKNIFLYNTNSDIRRHFRVTVTFRYFRLTFVYIFRNFR